MSLKVAIQMDPVADIDIHGDTSFAIGLEAQSRGFELFYYDVETLSICHGNVKALLMPLRLTYAEDKHFELGEARFVDLADMDVIWMRQDPPFDMRYITGTYFLEQLKGRCLVVNNPMNVRNFPEKLFSLQCLDLCPPTIITRNRDVIYEFYHQYNDIILKPLYGNGGSGVVRLQKGDENFGSLLDMFLNTMDEPMIAQIYLPEIRQGDKRVILVEGKVAGAVNRVPQKGDVRANLHIGGHAVATSLTERDYEICEQVGVLLRQHDILLAGIDIIGQYLTEINTTSPTCVREIEALGGGNIAVLIWDSILERLSV